MGLFTFLIIDLVIVFGVCLYIHLRKKEAARQAAEKKQIDEYIEWLQRSWDDETHDS